VTAEARYIKSREGDRMHAPARCALSDESSRAPSISERLISVGRDQGVS
jgi:hypothetical protein